MQRRFRSGEQIIKLVLTLGGPRSISKPSGMKERKLEVSDYGIFCIIISLRAVIE